MPPLLCPSPMLINQSFPRNEDELQTAAIALGELMQCVEQGEVHILLTDTFSDFTSNLFEWEGSNSYPLLREIYNLLVSLFLNPHTGYERVPEFTVDDYQAHPIPQECVDELFVEEWANEMGKLLILHNSYCPEGRFYIGIACAYGFGGGNTTSINGENNNCFPMVGRYDFKAVLGDAYEWHYLPDWYERLVSFEQARANCKVLGACQIDNPSGGSHYKVHFPGKRPWTLDPNTDPIPLRFLTQLEEITGYSLPAIKTALITGEPPESVCKLSIAARQLDRLNRR